MKTSSMYFAGIMEWLVGNTDLSVKQATRKLSDLEEVPGASFTYQGVTVTFTGKGYVGEK